MKAFFKSLFYNQRIPEIIKPIIGSTDKLYLHTTAVSLVWQLLYEQHETLLLQLENCLDLVTFLDMIKGILYYFFYSAC